jgi:hypothetical protein
MTTPSEKSSSAIRREEPVHYHPFTLVTFRGITGYYIATFTTKIFLYVSRAQVLRQQFGNHNDGCIVSIPRYPPHTPTFGGLELLQQVIDDDNELMSDLDV